MIDRLPPPLSLFLSLALFGCFFFPLFSRSVIQIGLVLTESISQRRTRGRKKLEVFFSLLLFFFLN